ncbi:hypothetical protein PENNAL_c0107G07853 [Penicillium nalgiovense]|uniref:Uncharacterized protein n=1 Tax=Penicillium nalgiovense TaxID=60175 RepID=A0A1V6X831_PENNA|nr:hypothetical protein PENNAL_c0877G02027 [Penicillium nalgiovense]OQE71314.1 hypothetical protein PENNAL_c0107G07853 [Penicillium nalgiovense]
MPVRPLPQPDLLKSPPPNPTYDPNLTGHQLLLHP